MRRNLRATLALASLLGLFALGCDASEDADPATAASTGDPAAGRADEGLGLANPRPMLLFSLSQGWSNDLLVNLDPQNPATFQPIALDRIIRTLQVYRQTYDAHALVNPFFGGRDKRALIYLCERLAAAGIPFVFDVYTSDNHTIAREVENRGLVLHSLADPARRFGMDVGTSGDPASLEYYHARFGAKFAGLRIFEVGMFDALVQCVRTVAGCSGLEIPRPLPGGRFYDEDVARKFVRYAGQRGKYVFWADLIYDFRKEPWGPKLANFQIGAYRPAFRDSMAAVIKQFPGTVIAGYANNGGRSRAALADWETSVKFPGARGFGVSDQTWGCFGYPDTNSDSEAECYGSYIMEWARDAMAKGASLIQFESFWGFFDFKVGARAGVVDATLGPTSGYPSDRGCFVATGLGVRLPFCDARGRRILPGPVLVEGRGLFQLGANERFCAYTSDGHAELNTRIRRAAYPVAASSFLDGKGDDGICAFAPGVFQVTETGGGIFKWDGARRCSITAIAEIEPLGGSLAFVPTLPRATLGGMPDAGICQMPLGTASLAEVGLIASFGDGRYCQFISFEHVQLQTRLAAPPLPAYPAAFRHHMTNLGVCAFGPGFFLVPDGPSGGVYYAFGNGQRCSVPSLDFVDRHGGSRFFLPPLTSAVLPGLVNLGVCPE